MSKVIIWGTKDNAQIAHFYLTHDTEHQVVGFTVNAEYVQSEVFEELPVYAFETLEQRFPPSEFALFLPMSQSQVNRNRAEKYREVKAKGYRCITYLSPRAIYYNTPVGENCFILENNVIQPFTRIGDNVTLWSGNHIGHHSVIEDHCFLSSHVVVSGHVEVGAYTFCGVNSTISNGVKIAPNCYIGAGALITQDTVENGVYPGTKSMVSKVPSHRIRF